MKKLMCWFLAALMLAMCVPAHADGDALAPAYSGTISVINPCGTGRGTSGLTNASTRCLDALLSQWQQRNPGIAVEVKQRTVSELVTLACMRHLPDVFLLDGKTGYTFSKYGLIPEITDVVLNAVSDRYDPAYVAPYCYHSRVAAFPVLSESVAAVVYDRSAWRQAGYEAFPDTWDQLEAGRDALLDAGYDAAIGFGDENGDAAVSIVLSAVLAGADGLSWFQKGVDREADFLFQDAEWLNALGAAQALFDTGVFNEDHYSTSAGEALDRFVNGKYPAILVYGGNLLWVLDKVRSADPERYADLGFAALPALSGAADGAKYMAHGISYGLFLNVDLADDPEKLRACLDLCQTLTGSEYADAMMENWGLRCFTEASEASKAAFRENCGDEVLLRLNDYVETGMTPCPNLSQFLIGEVWWSCARLFCADSRSAAKQNATPAEIASRMQDLYEQYYLN